MPRRPRFMRGASCASLSCWQARDTAKVLDLQVYLVQDTLESRTVDARINKYYRGFMAETKRRLLWFFISGRHDFFETDIRQTEKAEHDEDVVDPSVRP